MSLSTGATSTIAGADSWDPFTGLVVGGDEKVAALAGA